MTPSAKLLATLLAVAVLLAGCGRTASPPPPGGPPQTQAQAPARTEPGMAQPITAQPSTTQPVPAPVPKPLEPVVRQQWLPGTPEALAQGFFDWYMNQSKTQGSPIADGTYRNADDLHPGWIATVEAKLKEWRETHQPGLDLFLCAQNIADGVIVGPADIVGTEAALMAYHGPWDGEKRWSEMEVYLIRTGDRWKITRIHCRR
ncbi:MAG: hypothetical protein ACOY93_13745 [Bacillota bacterium]